MPPGEAHGELTSMQRLFRLLRDERSIFPIWEQLVSSLGVRGKKAHDARLAAAMQRHSLSYVLTFNVADFARYSFVTPISPVDVASGATLPVS